MYPIAKYVKTLCSKDELTEKEREGGKDAEEKKEEPHPTEMIRVRCSLRRNGRKEKGEGKG